MNSSCRLLGWAALRGVRATGVFMDTGQTHRRGSTPAFLRSQTYSGIDHLPSFFVA